MSSEVKGNQELKAATLNNGLKRWLAGTFSYVIFTRNLHLLCKRQSFMRPRKWHSLLP